MGVNNGSEKWTEKNTAANPYVFIPLFLADLGSRALG